MAINRNFIVKQGIQVGANATIVGTATSNAYYSNKVDVQVPSSFAVDFSKGYIDSRVQTIRSSNASYLAANGKIVEVGPNTPRIEWTPEGGCLGIACEEQRTNLVAYSDVEGAIGQQPRGFNLAVYADQSCTVSSDVWIGPNKQSAKHVRGTGPDGNVGYAGAVVGNNNTFYTHSMYIYIPGTSTVTSCAASFETGTLTVSPNPLASANVQIRDRWQRISATAIVTAGSGSGNYMVPVLRIEPAGAVVYSDCWQAEMGEYASSWIPTTNNVGATREAEYHQVYPFSQFIRNSAKNFTTVVEAVPKWTANSSTYTVRAAQGAVSQTRGIWSLDWFGADTGAGYGPYNGYGVQVRPYNIYAISANGRDLAGGFGPYNSFWTSGAARWVDVNNTGYSTGFPDSVNMVANTVLKMAVTLSPTFTRVALNGNANTVANNSGFATLYSANNNIDRLRLGLQNQGGAYTIFGGNIKRFVFYPTALSNTEILALTEL